MSILLRPVPYSFICEHVVLTWRDALWGYERQLIHWSDIVEIARDRLLRGSDNSLEIELSSLGKPEAQYTGELLRALAGADSEESGKDSDKKWLFLMLAWLFKNKESISDPLDEVERIYAEFDYPPEVACFVRYMPATDGYDSSRHSTEENMARLFSKWEQYLLVAKQGL